MESLKIQLELQNDVRNASEDLRNELNDMTKWEKEIKEKEKKRTKDCESEKTPPVRSHIFDENIKNNNKTPTHKEEKVSKKMNIKQTEKSDSSTNEKDRAINFKDKGNYHVKLGEYDKAIHFYDEAINCFNKDPAFYTNRALCYLKLERYNQCIEDCNQALSINPKAVKAFYRRMQAKESLGDHEGALKDCNKVLEIEPKNVEAIKAAQVLKNRLKPIEKESTKFVSSAIPNSPSWTKFNGDLQSIVPSLKAPHLRSKKTLKRIKLDEVIGNPKDTKNVENSNIASNTFNISDEVIDKLFNNNDVGSFIIKKGPTKPAEPIKPEKNPLPEKLPERKVLTIPPPPTTTPQFYSTWKELSNEQKYEYFKSIKETNINKILGASLDIQTLSEILNILCNFYIKDNNSKLTKVLVELSKHDEISILSLLLSSSDNDVLGKLIAHIKDENQEDYKIIKKNFNIK